MFVSILAQLIPFVHTFKILVNKAKPTVVKDVQHVKSEMTNAGNDSYAGMVLMCGNKSTLIGSIFKQQHVTCVIEKGYIFMRAHINGVMIYFHQTRYFLEGISKHV